jgi:hypothetical protein
MFEELRINGMADEPIRVARALNTGFTGRAGFGKYPLSLSDVVRTVA